MSRTASLVLIDGNRIGIDRQPASIRHGVARVDSQIDERRRQLVRIDQRRPDVAPLDAIDLDLPAKHRYEQVGRRRNQRLDIRAARPQWLLSCEREQIRRQLCAAVGGQSDHPDDRRHLRAVCNAVRESVDRSGNDRQQIVEVVRNPACEFADRLDFLRMRQPGLRGFPGRDFLLDTLLERPGQFAEVIFKEPALGNVHVDADQTRRLARFPNELRATIHPAHAVRAAECDARSPRNLPT